MQPCFRFGRISKKQIVRFLFFPPRFFNDAYHYPVIMFIEQDLNTAEDHRLIRSLTNSTVFIQLVQFELPSFLTEPVPPEIRGTSCSTAAWIPFVLLICNDCRCNMQHRQICCKPRGCFSSCSGVHQPRELHENDMLHANRQSVDNNY